MSHKLSLSALVVRSTLVTQDHCFSITSEQLTQLTHFVITIRDFHKVIRGVIGDGQLWINVFLE